MPYHSLFGLMPGAQPQRGRSGARTVAPHSTPPRPITRPLCDGVRALPGAAPIAQAREEPSVVDQVVSIGVLPLTIARELGCQVAYLPGLTMRWIADLCPGEAKTERLRAAGHAAVHADGWRDGCGTTLSSPAGPSTTPSTTCPPVYRSGNASDAATAPELTSTQNKQNCRILQPSVSLSGLVRDVVGSVVG